MNNLAVKGLNNRELNRTGRDSDCQADNEDSSDPRKIQFSHGIRYERKRLHFPVIRHEYDADYEHDDGDQSSNTDSSSAANDERETN